MKIFFFLNKICTEFFQFNNKMLWPLKGPFDLINEFINLKHVHLEYDEPIECLLALL